MRTLSRLLPTCMVLLMLGGAALGQGREGAPRPEVRGVVKSIDASTITITISTGREAAAMEKSYALAKDVEFCVPTGFMMGPRGGGAIFRPIKREDISTGISVILTLTPDQKTVESLVAEEPLIRGTLASVDAKKRTVTVRQQREREAPADEKTYTVAPNADIIIDDGRGRRFSMKEGKLDELSEGATLMLRLSLDKSQVHGIVAEGMTVFGIVKEVDATKNSIVVTVRPPRGDEAGEERTLKLSPDAAVFLDDGKGRRLSIKEGKLADVPVGSMVVARLAVDQSFAMSVRVEGPTVYGMLKGIDADKGTITIAIPKSRTEFDEKTLTVVKNARVNIDGTESKLADLKVGENGPMLQLRLALDQKTVQSVIARQPGSR